MIAVVVNPAAGNGRARNIASDVMRALSHRNDIVGFSTTARGDESRQVTRAIARGARCIVVVGGDGSVHHAVRALTSATRRVPLAVVAAGTGNDFVKSLATPAQDVHAMAQRIVRAQLRTIDVGVIDGTPFVNAAGLGFDVAVLERMRQKQEKGQQHWLGGTASYVITAMGALLSYRGFDASLHTRPALANGADDGSLRQECIGHVRHLMTVFANGRCFGGAFRIAPDARLDDGLLDVIDIGALAPSQRPALFFRAVRGTHRSIPAVHSHCGADFTLHCATPPLYEADGELYRASSATVAISVRPAALDLIV